MRRSEIAECTRTGESTDATVHWLGDPARVFALAFFAYFNVTRGATVEAANLRFILALALGGLFCTVGTSFYANKKIPYNHDIRHLSVMTGSVAHLAGNVQFDIIGG